MSDVSGRVLAVEQDILGSATTTAAAAGNSILLLEDVSDFEEGGGRAQTQAGDLLTYDRVDDDTNTLHLAVTLPANVAEGDAIWLYPRVVVPYALVGIDDAPDTPILARVPHALVRRMEAGVRDEDDRESVGIAEVDDGDWEVTDLLGREKARPGYLETDWRNNKGIPLIGGSMFEDVADSMFGVAVTSLEMFASFPNKVSIQIPAVGSGTVRHIGEGGVDSSPLDFYIDRPVKITAEGCISVLNDSAVPWNVRFWFDITVDGAGTALGRQATTYCGNDDAQNNRHRQVFTTRQSFVDATPEAPKLIRVWWALQNDSVQGRPADIANAKMTVRVSYAPDIPTATQPDRTPAWTEDATTIASYSGLEASDTP